MAANVFVGLEPIHHAVSASFSRNSLIYIVGGVVAAGGNVLLSPVYLRLLNPEHYGLWSKLNLLLQFLQPLMCWGLLAALTRVLASAEAERRRTLLGAATAIPSVLNGALLLALAAVLVPSGVVIGWLDNEKLLLWCLVLVAALSAYPGALMGVYVAEGQALLYRGLSLIGFSLQATIVLAVAAQGPLTIHRATFSLLAAWTLYASFCAYRLVRLSSWRQPGSAYSELLAFGVPVVLYTLAGQVSELVTRYVLAGRISTAAFGVYSAIAIYASVIAMVASAVNLAWVPMYYRQAEALEASGRYQRCIDAFAAASAIIAAFLMLFHTELLHAYSGRKIAASAPVVALLLMASWLNSAVWMGISNPLFQRGQARGVLLVSLGALVVSFPLMLILVARWAALGAALAVLCNALLLCIGAAWFGRRLTALRLDLRRIGLLLALLCLAGGLMQILTTPTSPGVQLVPRVGFFLAFCACSFFVSLRGTHTLIQTLHLHSK